MSINYNPKIVTDGLVLYLDAANPKSYPGSGTTITDLSGNGNNGTLVNGPTYDSSNNGSLTFNGSNTYISCGQILGLKTSPFTYESWVNTSASGTWRTIMGTQTSFAQICISSSNLIYMGQNAGGGWWISSGVTAIIGTGYHVVGTYDGTHASLYVNGVLKYGPYLHSFSSDHSTTQIGSYHSNGGEIFNGRISLAKAYNKALSQQEITQNFNATRGRFGL